MAAILAGMFAVPVGIFLAGRAEITLAFIGAAVLFLPLFVFLPKLIQRAMKADTDAAIDAFGKNEQVKKVFWTLFVSMAGLVLAQVVDPVTAQEIVGMITGMGGYPLFFPSMTFKNGGKIPSGKISPIRAPFPPLSPGQYRKTQYYLSFSVPVENMPYNRLVCQNTAELHLV